MMESSSIRKISSQKLFEMASNKKVKRIFHIKSLPAYDTQSARRISTLKMDSLFKESPEAKLRRFKSQQNLKPPTFGAVKTARERHLEWGKKKQQPSHQSQISKSLTKSTNFKSPNPNKQSVRKCSKGEKVKQKILKKKLSGVLKRVKDVMEEYQLKIQKCTQQNMLILRENDRLRNQLQSIQRRTKRLDK